jgi:hypothetical protein
VERILKSAAGPLLERLARRGTIPGDLLKDLRKATEVRNWLAHDYLLRYVVQKDLGSAKPGENIEMLQETELNFRALDDEVSNLSTERAHEQGMDLTVDHSTEEAYGSQCERG